MADTSLTERPADPAAPVEDRIDAPVEPDEPSADEPRTNEPRAGASAAAGPAAGAPAKPRRSAVRRILFLLLPVLLVAGGYWYVTGGQVVSTDNAYVQADTVGITSDVAGIVHSIDVRNNELVKKGQVLLQLEQEPFEIALEGARAQLGMARNQILALKAQYKQMVAEIAQAEADIPFYQKAFERQKDLVASAAASKAAYDQAKQNLDSAEQKVEVAKAQAAATLAQLGGDAGKPVEAYPTYLQAKSAVDKAERDLKETVLRAPFDGIVTNVPSMQVGAYLDAAQQAFSLVSTSNVWVTASPKETELTYVKPGQRVTVSVDTYPDVEWHGRVESISPASGSSFSLLPAQNTTGNWVKVVQRIPMIVRFDDLDGKPDLRVGMSATVSVDTGHARGIPTLVSDLAGYFQNIKPAAAASGPREGRPNG
ncbi:HlyD family secretion protein [Ancylobacter mangrovi]|uniref:HlyD family secretion protein n=1 Tax=Ancylobacter mangrovi TaxID=2972472 RepID=UPI0021633F71|nr:HlyD family secretion protein [Ancylobacter mangrovi]MCS0502900.1 HlyD family secretion protein [Ancylobacter mangrovi]